MVFFSGFTDSPASLRTFDVRNAILFQVKVFSRKRKVTMLVRYFIKVNALPSFAWSRIIRRKIKPIKYQNGEYVKKICISFWSRALGLSKMKELKQDIFGKGLFAARKGHLGLTKGHLDNPEGLMEVGSP